MTTITRERLLAIQSWRETYGLGSNVVLSVEEAEELARITLASLDAKPVGWTDAEELRGVEKDGYGYMFTVNPMTAHVDQRRVIKLYTATPGTVVPEEVPATLRDEIIDLCDGYEIGDVGAQEIWSACRLFMIQGESLPALV
ncbi:hypothetical protein ABVJ60_003127 [Salmonella enterica]|nr:hypothetical protein [Salmonella enterica]EDR0247367.1 hypothetical protein [Salmonella enterica subsp. enterica serovar Braenderup]EBR7444119.1 hypothetical protein [Salmonella enterica]EDL6029310.1 hypothetical protein [Salmonella enterica]EDZ5300234.1 hypothetical protein [Salmonella enterica]